MFHLFPLSALFDSLETYPEGNPYPTMVYGLHFLLSCNHNYAAATLYYDFIHQATLALMRWTSPLRERTGLLYFVPNSHLLAITFLPNRELFERPNRRNRLR